MAVSKLRYRISKFGTIILPDKVRRSGFCTMRIDVLTVRFSKFDSFERIPPQSVYGYVVFLDEDGYSIEREREIRFARSRYNLWEYPEDQVTQNICVLGNELYGDIMTELAKKPNTPPLPPSIPPLPGGVFQNAPRLVYHGVNAFTVKSTFDSDFDVELWYTEQAETDCSPLSVDIPPGSPPLQDSLPSPGGENGVAPPPSQEPLATAPNAPPLGGTGSIPQGFPSGYQSSPPNLRTFKWRIGRTGSTYVSTCSPSGGTRSPVWPTPPGLFPPAFYGSPVGLESQLGVASGRVGEGSGCTTPSGRVLGGFDFLINGVIVDANDAMQSYVMGNYKIYDDNGEWELKTIQAQGSQ